MSAARERMLEMGLDEVVGGVSPPDLTMRVLVAAREQGRVVGAEADAEPTRQRRWRLAAVSACALLLLGIAVGLVFLLEGSEVSQLASSSVKVRIVGPDGSTRWGDRMANGDLVVVPRSQPVTMTLSSGEELQVEQLAAVRFGCKGESVVPKLLAGSLRIDHVGNADLTVRTAFGRIVILPGSQVELSITGDPWMSGPALLRLARSWTDETPRAESVLVFGVETGSAQFLPEQMRIKPGEALIVSNSGATSRSVFPSAGERRLLQRLVLDVRTGAVDVDPQAPDAFARRKKGDTAAAIMLLRLQERADWWGYLLPYLREFPSDDSRQDVKRRLLRVLARDPQLRSHELINEALRTRPTVLDQNTLLLLGERGVEAAISCLGDLIADAVSVPDAVIPAAFFGMRGDPRGRVILEDARSIHDLLTRSAGRYFAAAAALTILGEENAWRRAVRNLESEVERRLQGGQVASARWLALTADYFQRAISTRKPVSLVELGKQLLEREQRFADSYDEATEIRSLMRRLLE